MQDQLTCPNERIKRLEAEAAAVRQAWELASGRIDANFGHVPEALRARDFIGMVMHKAIYESTSGKDLLERLERYEKALRIIQGGEPQGTSARITADEALKGDN